MVVSIPSDQCMDLPSSCFFSGFCVKTIYALLPHACHLSRPSHCPCFYYPNDTWCALQITNIFIMQFCPLFLHFLSFRPEVFLSTLFSNAPSLILI
jgi:hypothetical protein